jgi:hypothetical protein
VRHRIAPNWLLTRNERYKREFDELEVEKELSKVHKRLAREAYDEIKSGKMRSFRDEQTELEPFQKDAWRYMLVESDLNEESARVLIERLSGFRDKISGRFVTMILFIEAGASVTEQGWTVLVEHGMRLYWPADWQRNEAIAANAQLTTEAVIP